MQLNILRLARKFKFCTNEPSQTPTHVKYSEPIKNLIKFTRSHGGFKDESFWEQNLTDILLTLGVSSTTIISLIALIKHYWRQQLQEPKYTCDIELKQKEHLISESAPKAIDLKRKTTYKINHTIKSPKIIHYHTSPPPPCLFLPFHADQPDLYDIN